MKNKVKAALKSKTDNIFREEWYEEITDFVHALYTVGELMIDFSHFLPMKVKRGSKVLITSKELREYCDNNFDHPVSSKMATTQFMRYLASNNIPYKRTVIGNQRMIEVSI